MIKPSYTEGFWNKTSLEKFKELHKHVEYFSYLNDSEWIAEYEKATGKTYKVENDAEKVAVKKPINKGV
jgi:hypothetical protein